jgi:hypothetical protein
MITEDEFLAMVKAKPDMSRAFQKAVNAVVEFRIEDAANPSGLWAKMRLKKKAFTAIFLAGRLTDGLVLNGQPASDDDKERVRSWINGAAGFLMSSKDQPR